MKDTATEARAGPSAIVVGAGMGGLTAAVDLARQGLEVTVFEASTEVGGKARSVRVGGVPIDVGPTVFTMYDTVRGVFADAGVDLHDRLTLRRAEVIARHAWPDGSRLDLVDDLETNARAIAAFAGPRAGEGYRAFMAAAQGIHDAVEGPFIQGPRPTLLGTARALGPGALGLLGRIDGVRTMWRALGRYFPDPRLRQLFGRYATYVGGSPFDTPATFNLIAHVEQDGVWHVEGGMSRLAAALAELAVSLGATIHTGQPVREVLVDGGRAAGVRLADGTAHRADVVVLGADTHAVASGRFGDAARGAVEPTRVNGRSFSAVTFAALVETRGLELSHHNVFFGDDSPGEFRDLARGRLPESPTVYLCAPQRAPGVPPPTGPEPVFTIVNAPALGDAGGPTEREVLECRQRALKQLARCGLSLTPRSALFTMDPVAFEARFPGTGGALYGPSPHGMTSALRRPGARSKLPGLYLCGGSVHPGPGVPMAMLSGRRAADAVSADLPSTSPSRPVATSGGTWTSSPMTATTP